MLKNMAWLIHCVIQWEEGLKPWSRRPHFFRRWSPVTQLRQRNSWQHELRPNWANKNSTFLTLSRAFDDHRGHGELDKELMHHVNTKSSTKNEKNLGILIFLSEGKNACSRIGDRSAPSQMLSCSVSSSLRCTARHQLFKESKQWWTSVRNLF